MFRRATSPWCQEFKSKFASCRIVHYYLYVVYAVIPFASHPADLLCYIIDLCKITVCLLAAQELTSNHRQSGDVEWGSCLDTLRTGTDVPAVDSVYRLLKTRLGNLSGGPVRGSDFDGAMRLLPKNDQVDNHNALQLSRLVQGGAERMRLVAGHCQVGPSGQIRRERISSMQIPKSTDKLRWFG